MNPAIKGLNKEQVNERIAKGLQNKSSKTKSKKIREIFIENIFSLFNLIIFSIIIILLIFYFQSGDRRLFFDSIGVFSVAVINTLIAIIQGIRAKRALDKVSLLLKKEVFALRDGQKISIDQTEVVEDDYLFIERGDQVVVDGKIINSNHLEIDESLLTGESHPVFKNENDKVLSGSFCVSGNGMYIAEKVGDLSYAAGITRLAKTYKLNLSPLQIKINFIVKMLFGSALILVLLEILFYQGKITDIDFIRRLSTITISLVPQGLVLMSSVTFALGIYRISKIGAIVQKLNAIESFSNVKIVCTDKTGTLTKNKLHVNKLTVLNDKYDLSYSKKLLGTYYKLSSDKNATLQTLENYEPIEEAELIDEIPFSSESKRSLIQLTINNQQLTIIFGGLDVLISNVTENYKDKIENNISRNKLEVYRNLLLGFVDSNSSFGETGKNIDDIKIEPVCIVSLTDEVRDDVMEAINLFKENDIQVKILSGDSAPSIQAVAREIGWDIKDEELISGNELDEVSDTSLKETILAKSIFARLKPEHKLRIIKALKKEKIYTAMIGDGVNDLPAIKESDMGIAMEEGSKITKEVADIVLLKNKFTLLPQIFNEGNKIVNTVNSAAKLFLTKNFLVIYLTLLSVFFLLHFPLTPRRVSLINIFSIGLPALIIALKNTNTAKSIKFFTDLFSFVTVSALIIVGASFAGQIYSERFLFIDRADMQMIMLSIMIITTVSNFLAVAIRKGEKNIPLYLLYAFLLLVLYVFLVTTKIDFVLFKILKEFYEIRYLPPKFWPGVIIISLIASSLIVLLQKTRNKLMVKNSKNN